MGVLENYKARVTGTVGSSLKEYVKNQVRTNLDTFLESGNPRFFLISTNCSAHPFAKSLTLNI